MRRVPFPSAQNDSNPISFNCLSVERAIQKDIDDIPSLVPKTHHIGPEFVNLYYNVLVRSPELMYKFYQDRSILSRPTANGQMVTGPAHEMEKQITSRDHRAFKVEIKTVDSQASYNRGLLVVVSGSIIFKTNETHTFTQIFFLAPRKNGYFVLNDVFKYVGEEPKGLEKNLGSIDGCIVEQYAATTYPVSETVAKPESVGQVQPQIGMIDQCITVVEERAPAVEKVQMQKREVPESSAGRKVAAIEHVDNKGPPCPTQETPVVVQDAAEKSFALVVKENAAPPTVKAIVGAVPNAAQTKETTSNSTSRSIPVDMADNNIAQGSVCSIFINNLPANVTTPQVDKELKKFWAIKPSGIELRSREAGGSSYTFVEFEEAASVQTAIEASPIVIVGCKAFNREKRPFRERLKNGARGRGAYSFRGRGIGRSDFVNKTERGSLCGRRSGGIYKIKNGGLVRSDGPDSSIQ